jgi:hypothetical protein
VNGGLKISAKPLGGHINGGLRFEAFEHRRLRTCKESGYGTVGITSHGCAKQAGDGDSTTARFLSERSERMKFAKRVFLIAGIYGLIVVLPMYLLEDKTGRDFPPVITHPEYYYGFIGVTVAWQILFITLSKDPIRYRLMMIPAILEKVSFGVAIIVLFWQERASIFILAAALVDLCLGVLFVMSYLKTSEGQNAG